MFNLIVKGAGWTEGRDTFGTDRVFEHTEDDLEAEFARDGKVSFDRLRSFPCIFMEEGLGDEIARVGFINRYRLNGPVLTIEFSYDIEIPPLLNRDIYKMRSDLDIRHDFEFSRTHWALKEIDLYRVLLRNIRPRRQRPTVFAIAEHERIEQRLVSVMMPFGAEFAPIYKSIKSAVEDAGLKCRRADEIWENPSVIQDVVSLIDRSRVVICDCSGRNANVFYEAGIAHTLGRHVVLITQNESDIPFDLRHIRYVQYLGSGLIAS